MSKEEVLTRVWGIMAGYFDQRNPQRETLIGKDQPFASQNADEGDFLEIITQVRSAFNLEIDTKDLLNGYPYDFQSFTSRDIADFVHEKLMQPEVR
jgi:hypothetical protein